MTFLGYNVICPGCFSPQYWGIPHDCHYKPVRPEQPPALSDADIDRIAQRIASILQTHSGKRSAEQ